MNNFCKDLKEHETKIFSYVKEKMITVNNWRNKSYCQQKTFDIRRKQFISDDSNKRYYKVRDHCHYPGKYRGATHKVCNLRYKTPKEFPVVFHNGSKYDYIL